MALASKPATKKVEISSDAQIRALPNPDKDKLIHIGGREGLYLRVRTSGKRTWVTRRRIDGAWRVETLGDFPALTLFNARRTASLAETRQTGATTFGEAVEDFYKQAIEPTYRSAPGETKAYLVRDCRPLLTHRLDRITQTDIVKLIRAKTADAPNAAAKMLAIVKQFFAWCQLGGLIEVNPVAALTAKALKIPAQQPRERKLSDDELRSLWAMPEPFGPVLRFALLTGGRIGEAIQFESGQIEGDLWTIPMTKNGKPHTVPLGPSAAALAKIGWPARTYEAVWSHIVSRGIKWRPHDLRRTAATRMREAGVAVEVIEAVLNHTPAKLLRTYQQPDMLPAMRDALKRLDAAVSAIVTQTAQTLTLVAA
jgi:integrase